MGGKPIENRFGPNVLPVSPEWTVYGSRPGSKTHRLPEVTFPDTMVRVA
jgi:hypothetical protein